MEPTEEQALKRWVRISIDDFGTGHSSFACFRSLPADELKIDRSFVANLAASAADGHIVRSIIDLAHRFDFTVVAEGIEESETADLLRDMQCDVPRGTISVGRRQPKISWSWAALVRKWCHLSYVELRCQRHRLAGRHQHLRQDSVRGAQASGAGVKVQFGW